MGLLQSHPKRVNRQVKPCPNGCNRCAHIRVLDNKSAQHSQNSLGESKRKVDGILSWWNNLFSLLTKSIDIQSHDGTSTPETQHSNPSLSPKNCTCGRYCGNTSTSTATNRQYNIVNEYLNARCNPNQQRVAKTDSHILETSYLRNNSSYDGRVDATYYQQPTEIDNTVTSRCSPYSTHAISEQKSTYACIRNPEPEEISIAQAEVMYRQATWRMYERITLSRAAAAVTKQRFCLPNVLHESVNDVYPEDQQATVRHCDSKIAETGPFSEERFQHDLILGSSLSVDRHHICFDMDHD